MTSLSELAPIIRFAQHRMRQDEQKVLQEGVDATVERIASADALAGVPRAMVEDAIFGHAHRNSNFDDAFKNREDNQQRGTPRKKPRLAPSRKG